jgi:hypothetical protein
MGRTIEKQKAPRTERLLRFSGSPGKRFPRNLVAQTEALQERRWLGILHRRVLGSGIGYGRDLCILLLPDPCSMISLRADLCACILHGPDLSVLFHGADPRWGILHPGSLHGLSGPSLSPCLFRGRPSLELLEQGLSKWLADLGLVLAGLSLALAGLGLALTDLGTALIGRFHSRSNFVARRRVRRRRQILSAGNRLNC